jgi:hypothetical protein
MDEQLDNRPEISKGYAEKKSFALVVLGSFNAEWSRSGCKMENLGS